MSPALKIAGATAVVAAGQVAQGRTPGIRLALGGGIAAFLLAVAAGPLPGLANGIATLAVIGALLTSGYAAIRPLLAITNR